MSARTRTILFGLPWLAAIMLTACTTAGPQPARQAAQDAFYEGLSAEEAATAHRAVQEALETRLSDDTFIWAHASGSSGSVTPLRTFRIKTGHYCRDYTETIARGAENISILRTACRSSQGTWLVVKR